MEFSFASSDFVTKSFLQNIIDRFPAAISVVYGPEFVIKLVNQLNLELWQRKYEEVFDKPLFEAFPETASQEFKKLLTHVYETGETFQAKQVPAQLFRNNVFETIWADIKYEALRDDAGIVKAIMVTSTDVSNEVLLQQKVDEITAAIENDPLTKPVLESSPDCLKLLDSEGRIQYINKNGLALLGISSLDTVRLKYWWQLWPIGTRQTILNALQQVKETGSAGFTAESHTLDNTLKTWDVQLSLAENKKIGVQIIAVSRDVTDKYETKQKFKKTTERLQGGLKVASIALAEINYSTNMAELSPEAAAMYGFPEGTTSVSRQALHNSFHPDHRASMEVLIAKSLDPAGDGLIEIEHPVVHSNGAVRWLKVNKQVYFNRQVEPPVPWYSILAVKDITTQKNVSRLLQESEAKYRELFEKLNQAFCIIQVIFDEAGKAVDCLYLECNNAFQEQSGLKDVIGKTTRQLVPNIEQKWLDMYGEVAKKGKAVHVKEYSAVLSKWYDVYAYRHNNIKNDEVAILFTDITESKTYEQIILESEQKFRDIFTLSAVGIAVTQVDGTFNHVNQAYVEILGYTLPEMEQQNFYQFLHQDDVDSISSNIHQLLQCNKPGIVAEARFAHKQGHLVWTQLSMSVIDDRNGLPLHVISLVEDITEKKKVTEELRNSESMFRNIFENSSVSVWVEDFSLVKKLVDNLKQSGITDFVSYAKEHPDVTREFVKRIKVLDVNDYSLRMFEASTKSELIKGFDRLFSDDILPLFGDEMQAIADNRRYFEAERVTKTLKGKELHLLVSISFPIGTNYNTVLVSIIDITQRKQAEAEMKASENRFRTLAETLPQLVWMADESGANSYISSQWEQYTGITDYTPQQFWEKVVYPEDRDKLEQRWQQAMKEKKPFKEQVRFKHYTGTYRWNECAGYPVFSGSTYPGKWIGIVNDIHDLKETEQLKDDFVGIASHEMKTPLTTAKGFLQLMMEQAQSADQSIHLFATKALEAVNRLEALTTELLDVTRIKHGHLTLDFDSFDFNRLVEETVENIQSVTPKHTIVKTGRVVKMVNGDKYRLQQVLINLLNNAVKYSPGATRVEVHLQDTKDRIVVGVKDFGIGLDNTHREKIFERYYRVPEHATTFKGLGIGLYISYNIVLRHGGTMWVESELNKGSIFYFSIPV